MDVDALRRLALELLRRQPAAFADLVNGELPGLEQNQPEDPPNDYPEWCHNHGNNMRRLFYKHTALAVLGNNC